MAEFQSQNRRDFLRYMFGTAAVMGGLELFPNGEALAKKGVSKLTVLYTNDTHSRIDPFPTNDPKFPDQGGFARRAAAIKKIRSEEEQVLLLDAGDIFQGTPYFNMYEGELEYKLMSAMGYDCVTIGNHDFDLGMENIIKQKPYASFDFVNANYGLEDTPLSKVVKPYKIYYKGGIKIGVFGVGIELAGLVPDKLCKNVQFFNPVVAANDIAKTLKQEEKCDVVICLSHLGYKSEGNKPNDIILGEQTGNIDLIIGGHTHTFLELPTEKADLNKKMVHITQVGWAGIWLGRYDIYLSKNNNVKTNTSASIQLMERNRY
ncbi:MAG: 5-nucleotidase [Bacteroidetes bacterium]|jgi:5'-nucleotidase|nr:5-nucleotidase [Bacteroidota bacterium]